MRYTRPHRSSVLLEKYADHLLRTPIYRHEYICRSTGIRPSRLRLYPEEFLRIRLLCPAIEEQHAICEYASKKLTKTQRSIELAHEEISVLDEYRTRLIADAVTGKIDVRKAAAALPAVDPLDTEDDFHDTFDTDTQATLEDLDVSLEEA